jgi:thiol:disulfide interchange protein DsbD
MNRRWIILSLLGFAVFVLAGVAEAQLAAHATLADAEFSTTALQPGQQAVAAVVLQINDGFHAQSHTPSDPTYIKFIAQADANSSLTVFDPIYPAGEDKNYPNLGQLNVYTGRVTIFFPIEVKSDAPMGAIKFSGALKYQCCDEHACYPPSNTTFTIETTIVPAGQRVDAQKPELFKDFDPKVFSHLVSATQPSTGPSSGASGSGGGTDGTGASNVGPTIFGIQLTDTSYFLAFAAAFAVGIIFNAVPCVLPVLPLKAIGFYEASHHSRAKSLAFGAVFSAGLITCFGVLAQLVVVPHFGHRLAWGQLYSYPWFTISISLILLVMAIGTFGVFTINLPPAVYSVAPRHDTYLGNFLFGFLTAVLSTPCTIGMFVLLLAWATRQTPLVGMLLVMTVGAGMASPYLLLSGFPEVARRFPRTGPWAELVKQMMSFLLLASAVYFARQYVADVTGSDGSWWTLFAVAVIAAGYLLLRTFQISSAAVARLVGVGIAVAIVLPSFFFVLRTVNPPYDWKPYSEQALMEARQAHRVALVEFTAKWCGNCQYLETFVLHDKSIVSAVKRHDVEMLKADLTADDAPGWTLLKQLNPVAAIPFTAVYQPGQNEPVHLSGIYSTSDLRDAIDHAGDVSLAMTARGE